MYTQGRRLLPIQFFKSQKSWKHPLHLFVMVLAIRAKAKFFFFLFPQCTADNLVFPPHPFSFHPLTVGL